MEEQNQNANSIIKDHGIMDNNEQEVINQVHKRLRKRRPRHPPYVSFKTKYPLLLKELHPTLKMSFRLVNVFDSVVNHLYHRIVNEAKELAYLARRNIILQRDIETACSFIFPPELLIHVEKEASKSIRRYNDAS